MLPAGSIVGALYHKYGKIKHSHCIQYLLPYALLFVTVCMYRVLSEGRYSRANILCSIYCLCLGIINLVCIFIVSIPNRWGTAVAQ